MLKKFNLLFGLVVILLGFFVVGVESVVAMEAGKDCFCDIVDSGFPIVADYPVTDNSVNIPWVFLTGVGTKKSTNYLSESECVNVNEVVVGPLGTLGSQYDAENCKVKDERIQFLGCLCDVYGSTFGGDINRDKFLFPNVLDVLKNKETCKPLEKFFNYYYECKYKEPSTVDKDPIKPVTSETASEGCFCKSGGKDAFIPELTADLCGGDPILSDGAQVFSCAWKAAVEGACKCGNTCYNFGDKMYELVAGPDQCKLKGCEEMASFKACMDSRTTETTAPVEDKAGPLFSPELQAKIKDLNQLKASDIQTAIGNTIGVLMGVVGSISLVMFVYGGLLWMVSRGNSESTKKAVGIMTWTALGIILILSSYAVVKFVFKLLGQ